MKWLIPAKTFLLGEYAAIAGESAIVLTTTPCFELALVDEPGLHGIHPDSPAGVWWNKQNHTQGLSWEDPYKGCGGLGASSAQFLGSYLASCHLNQTTPNPKDMIQAYYDVSWSGTGLKPSGYDVTAQAQSGCVFINKNLNEIQCHPWVFDELSFTLIHTGMKLATHHHLNDIVLPNQTAKLSSIARSAQMAFQTRESTALINSINAYHQQLLELNLVAEHTKKLIEQLKNSHPEVLAIKGCGAMGADVILLISNQKNAPSLRSKLKAGKHHIIATELDLHS